MYKKLQERIYKLVWMFDDNPIEDLYDLFMVTLLIINLAAIVLETISGIYEPHKAFFHAFDIFTICIFLVDYMLKVWTCVCNPKYTNRFKYIISPIAVIDLLSALPSFLLNGIDPRVLRFYKILRLFRILKLTRYCKSFRIIEKAFIKNIEILTASFMVILIVLFSLSSIVYYCENAAQPDKFSSIPNTFWWGVVTLTSVGYGDIYPITALGKFFTCIIAMIAIPLCAIPGGVIFSGLVKEMSEEK